MRKILNTESPTLLLGIQNSSSTIKANTLNADKVRFTKISLIHNIVQQLRYA